MSTKLDICQLPSLRDSYRDSVVIGQESAATSAEDALVVTTMRLLASVQCSCNYLILNPIDRTARGMQEAWKYDMLPIPVDHGLRSNAKRWKTVDLQANGGCGANKS